MSLISIISLLLGIAIAQLKIQSSQKPPEPEPPKKQLSLDDIQGILVVYPSSKKPD
jgi:hypothetical protein